MKSNRSTTGELVIFIKKACNITANHYKFIAKIYIYKIVFVLLKSIKARDDTIFAPVRLKLRPSKYFFK